MNFLETTEGILLFSVIGLAIYFWIMYKVIQAGSYSTEIYNEQVKQTKLLAEMALKAGVNEGTVGAILEPLEKKAGG